MFGKKWKEKDEKMRAETNEKMSKQAMKVISTNFVR